MTDSIAITDQSDKSGASEEAIQAHYDISNDFYALWLDPLMVYSCALWEEGDDLLSAQLRKIDFHLDQAEARGKKNLLDVGCGWGALLKRAVDSFDVKNATGLTLSQAQLEWGDEARPNGVSVFLENWQDHVPNSPYDAIVSIGAFEHFAKAGISAKEKSKAYRHFFEWCHKHSTDDCYLSLQSIVYENYDERNPNPFVEEIFPESELPRASEMLAACAGLFEVVRLRNDRAHYAKTLQSWYLKLRKNKEKAIALVGKATYERYEKYLGVFVVGFHTGTVNLTRLKARKIPNKQ